MSLPRRPLLLAAALALPACAPAEAPRATPITRGAEAPAGRPPSSQPPRAIATH